MTSPQNSECLINDSSNVDATDAVVFCSENRDAPSSGLDGFASSEVEKNVLISTDESPLLSASRILSSAGEAECGISPASLAEIPPGGEQISPADCAEFLSEISLGVCPEPANACASVASISILQKAQESHSTSPAMPRVAPSLVNNESAALDPPSFSGNECMPQATDVRNSPTPSVSSEDDGINTDDRHRGDWDSIYSLEARKEIRLDGWIAGGIFIGTLIALFLTWNGTAYSVLAGDCSSCRQASFYRYAYFMLGGLLGGSLFGIKYLYKVVARARWTLDRRLWRIFSPLVSGGLAVAVAALTDSGILGLTTKAIGGSSYLSLGFIAGYFADSALAKMQEIAETIFGSTDRHRHAENIDKSAGSAK